ncbi:MAG: beta-N-acetylhexosaminidase [Porticoccus sp.]|nr:beta-N-acetylhexosaminidase [Porticoccus sp.]
MTLGPLMLDLEGLTLTTEETELIQNSWVGGVIFFARNFEHREQIMGLVAEIRAIRPELLLCVDQEGGRVQRFKEGFTRIPPMQVLGDQMCESVARRVDSGSTEHVGADNAEDFLQDVGWLMASELLACGIDFSFAPVLDVDRAQCEVIANRSFSDDPEAVIFSARAFIKGMHEAGMATTGKHFPGHGGVRADSHLETPYDDRSLEILQGRDLLPFVHLANELDAVMPAHIVFPSIDEDAVGFSRYWLQEILRGELQFEGVIFSDDLSMKGADVAGSYADKARCALLAGCDMVLVCNNRQGVLEVLDYLKSSAVEPSSRLSTMSARQSLNWETLISTERWLATSAVLLAHQTSCI